MTKIDIIVFDLDDTLLDTSRLLLPISNTPEFEKKIHERLPLMEDALSNLEYLHEKYRLILLTQGKKEIQFAKIKSLGISEFFYKVLFANLDLNEKKEDYFRQIKDWVRPGHRFLSIGNRISTDLIPAKKFQALTCHFKYGEHLEEKVQSEEISDFVIHNHKELILKCNL